MRKIKLIDYFKKYKGLSHQIAAIQELQGLLPEELLKHDAAWVTCFDCDDGMNQLPE
mgnify:FL=1